MSTGAPPPLGMCNMGMSVPDRTGSLPHGMRGIDGGFGIYGNFEDFRFQTLGMKNRRGVGGGVAV